MRENKQIIISVETGKGKIDCAVICSFEIDSNDYIALMPLTGNAGKNQEIQLFRYTALDNSNYEGIKIYTIEDDTEFETALEAFDELMSENN